ncbi:MAG: hypothetical protein JXB62_16065 [Pirellulales bacterium]|nr:hypothetical protein [Pirellulales bacterium]
MTSTVSHVPPRARSRPRRWIERLVWLALAALAMRTWYVQGLLIPCQVTSGSMAETLLGPHREVICGDCGHRFVCGADLRPVSVRAVCPYCGHTQNDLETLPDIDGDRLLIGKSSFAFRRPRRWEVVALRRPREADRIHVKRVVGLPGETVLIRHGDVFADGQIRRKTLSQQRAMAILVHDATCRPTLDPVPPTRWQAERADSRWGASGGRFARPSMAENEPIDWLVYHHWHRRAGPRGSVVEGPVTDLVGYNQTRPRRQEDVHPVTDLLLSLRLIEASGPGRLLIRADDGSEQFDVRIDPSRGRYEVLHNGRPLGTTTGRLPDRDETLLVEVSLFDQQFLLAFDGRPAFAPWPYERRSAAPKPKSQPLAIGAQGLGVLIHDVAIYRDVYYTHSLGFPGHTTRGGTYKLGPDEYFVLGDNSPISDDSRTWPEGHAVDAKFLVGKPLLVHFPARPWTLGGWVFQVPDSARIRYIR